MSANTQADTIKRNRNAVVVYSRLLALRESFGRLKPDQLPEGVHQALTGGLDSMTKAVIAKLPQSVLNLAK